VLTFEWSPFKRAAAPIRDRLAAPELAWRILLICCLAGIVVLDLRAIAQPFAPRGAWLERRAEAGGGGKEGALTCEQARLAEIAADQP
jgi:hypothetical protein